MAKASRLATSIVDEANGVLATLVEIGLADAVNMTYLRQETVSDWRIQSPGLQLAAVLKPQPYASLYDACLADGSFTALLLDGGLLQVAYAGSKETVLRHRLAFFPNPRLEAFQNETELYLGEEHFAEVVGPQVVPAALRFDFDSRPGVASEIVHPVSHLTLGQYKHCRLPVSSAVTPAAFAGFVVHNFYTTPAMTRVSFRAKLSAMAMTLTSGEQSITHLRLP